MDDWPQICNDHWYSPGGRWASVEDVKEDIANNKEEFEARVGSCVIEMMDDPGAAMTALRWNGRHVQISRSIPGAPLVIKEITP